MVTTVRELQRRVAAGIVVMPSELRAIVLVFATLAVATVLLVQRDEARAQRDRVRQQTASATRVAIQAGHQNQALLRELERVGQRVRDASHAAAVAARHERRWRQIAARRRQDAQRGRHHR